MTSVISSSTSCPTDGLVAQGVVNNSAAYEGLPIFIISNRSFPSGLACKAQEMRVNWATSPGAQAKVDTSKLSRIGEVHFLSKCNVAMSAKPRQHFHVFIGDLSPEIDNKTLRDAFAPYGEISDVKVIRDLQTLKSKGYGFVSFVTREDAERAIEQMNGQWLGRRMIRTNWATRKPGLPGTITFDDIMAQSSPNNMTVYVGGVGQTVTEEDLRRAFAKFGSILEIRIFKQQGYAFVRFDNKESAAHAIMNVTGADIGGSTVRCSWGKEGNNPVSYHCRVSVSA
ncbi:hypothetical protein D918_01346 [Trichuris suis]|nr:hypothetical protein D918_01346 [Trichuris suis]